MTAREELSAYQRRDLAELAAVAAQLAAAERLTDAIRDRRDRLVIAQAEAGTPHAVIGESAELSVKGVGKITRAAGLSRYSARLEHGAVESTEGESVASASEHKGIPASSPPG